MTRNVNQATIDLIKSFEGDKLKAYQDSVGVWTIGYGHTHGVHAGQVITQAQAEQFLRDDLSQFEDHVEQLVTTHLTDNQFGALVSFAYNCGASNLQHSTLLKLVNAKQFKAAAGEFAKWNKAGGTPLAGLTRRRAAEAALFGKE